MVDTKKLTGDELLSGLDYVQRQLFAAQEQAERYIMLDGQYKTKQALPSRAQFGGQEPHLAYEKYIKGYSRLAGLRKLGLVRFGIPAALSIFTALIFLLALLTGEGFSFGILVPFGCLALLVRDQRKGNTKITKLQIFIFAFLAFFSFTMISGILSGGMNIFLWILLAISAVGAVLIMLALNRSAQRLQNQETDAKNEEIAAKNEEIAAENRRRDARRQQADEKYRQALARTEEYNRQVPEHNCMIDAQQKEAIANGFAIMDELISQTQDWYPPDYYTHKAVDFFINAMRNGKADNMKELILQFDDQERWEDERADRYTIMEYMNDIRAIGWEQLNSSIRQEQKLEEISRYQAEISGLIWQQNMIQVMNGLRQSYENDQLRNEIRQSSAGIESSIRQSAAGVESSIRQSSADIRSTIRSRRR